jgi:hypothetical protein
LTASFLTARLPAASVAVIVIFAFAALNLTA